MVRCGSDDALKHMRLTMAGKHQRLEVGTPQQLSTSLRDMLQRSTLDERIELLAGALVVEAFQPFWHAARTPAEAHAALRRADPELADTIEAIAPMLLARLECREESSHAVAAAERLLRALE